MSRPLVLAEELAAVLGRIPGRYADEAGHRRGVDELRGLVEAAGGTLGDTGPAPAIVALGYRATSTMGPIGACRNWITQVRLREREERP